MHNSNEYLCNYRSWDSAACLVPKLQAGQPRIYHLIPWEGQANFLLNVQGSSGAHPVSHSVVTGILSWWWSDQGCEADHSPPRSAKIKYNRCYTFTDPNTLTDCV